MAVKVLKSRFVAAKACAALCVVSLHVGFADSSSLRVQHLRAAAQHMGATEGLLRTSEKLQRNGDKKAFGLRLRGGSSQVVANFEEVGNAFVQHYYNIFDTNRAGLHNLYQDVSMLTFEGEKHQGAQSIMQKLGSLPFTSVKHEVVTVDSQPTASGGVMVSVCGNLKVDGSENPMKFSQVFSLHPLSNGQGYFCYNDIFRLNYG